jgi:hypothetical protein
MIHKLCQLLGGFLVGHEEDALSFEQIVMVLNQAQLGMPVADFTCQTEIPGSRSMAGRSSAAGCNRLRSGSWNIFPKRARGR